MIILSTEWSSLIVVKQENLNDKNTPFGVDLALPPVGGNARKTNHDYTHGKLDELIDIIIEFKPKLFISALGGKAKDRSYLFPALS